MMEKPPLFVELCAGSAAVTLRLIGGPKARPPISYMGSKRGYAEAILAVLGLRAGQGAGSVVLVEAGPWAKVWRLLTTPQGCQAVAEVIRGWIGEDARALWDRLRAEPVPESWGEREVGAWCCLQDANVGSKAVGVDDGSWKTAGYANVSPSGLERGFVERLRPDILSEKTAALSALSWPPVQIVEGDAMAVDPRDVARWLRLQASAVGCAALDCGPKGWRYFGGVASDGSCSGRLVVPGWKGPSEQSNGGMAGAIDRLPAWPPTTIAQADAAEVQPGTLPLGTVVYMDPPYQGCTGYGADLPRASVLEVARRWSNAGATVCVSEAEPLPLDGWHHVEITDCRRGQKRTFSKQKREWLTLNRPPAWRPEKQGEIFDAYEVQP